MEDLSANTRVGGRTTFLAQKSLSVLISAVLVSIRRMFLAVFTCLSRTAKPVERLMIEKRKLSYS